MRVSAAREVSALAGTKELEENKMKRIGALRGMRWMVSVLSFLAGYTVNVAVAHPEIDAPDSLRIELNPLEYVPLAVGNRWTYEHWYYSGVTTFDSDFWRDTFDSDFWRLEGLKRLEFIEFPDSLSLIGKTLTIEITHTEMIDGLEYFVFSDADYVWPPLPALFWGGKKVRLSDEGFLVFRWNGQEVPVYDLDHHHFDRSVRPVNKDSYTFTIPGKSDTTRVNITRSMYFYVDRQPIAHFKPDSRYAKVVFGYSQWTRPTDRFTVFLSGYGIGQVHSSIPFFDTTIYQHILTPISATIDREEILYPDHTLSDFSYTSFFDEFLFPELPDTTTAVQPTSWGQLKQLFLGRNSPYQY